MGHVQYSGRKLDIIDFLGRCKEYVYRFVYLKLKDSTFPKGSAHPKCKSAFTLRHQRTLHQRNAPETGNNYRYFIFQNILNRTTLSSNQINFHRAEAATGGGL